MDKLKKIQILLGDSFYYIDKNYKVRENNKNKKIDYLFFNDIINCYVVVQVFSEDITVKHVKDMSIYTKYIDINLRKKDNNKTIGVVIREKNNIFNIDYVSNYSVFRKVCSK